MNFIAAFAVLGTLWTSCSSVLPPLHQVHTKFEFLQSFKGPHLVDPKGNIPFWNHGGSAIPSEDSIRVCPSIKSRRGWVWSKNPLSSSHWYIDVSIKVTGRLVSGADGMAIWVTEKPGTEGLVFGNTATWKGIALFLDSFDNDGAGDNPKIQLVLNDGSVAYEHYKDGKTQEAGSCLKDFRNRPHPVKIRLMFLRGTLEVWVHEGLSMVEDDYELCLRVQQIPALAHVPGNMFFGVSAATGGLSDDHDVLGFLTYSMSTYEQKAAEDLLNNNTVFEEMMHKYNQLSGEFDQRRENYQRQHPDQYPHGSGISGDIKVDSQREVQMDRSIKLVADMQVALQNQIRSVDRKIDVIILGRQGTDMTGSAPKDSSPNALYGLLSSELAQMKTVEGNILHQIADLRAAMDRSMPAGARATASEQMQPVYEIKAMVSQQQQALDTISSLLQELVKIKCPTPSLSSSCITTWMFVAVVIVQLLVLVGYSCYRDAQERSAKKFF